MQIIMPKTINGEEWLSMNEAADYIERSRQGLTDNIRKYEKETGNILARMRDGNNVMVRRDQLDEIIKRQLPFVALKKGLTPAP